MATPAKKLKAQTLDTWVKARRIAALFDVDEGTVYRGEAGLDRIRSAYLPSAEGASRRARRFYWPDAIKLRDEMLAETSPREEIPARIIKLMGRGRIRRK